MITRMNLSDVPKRSEKLCKIQDEVDRFYRSDWTVAEVATTGYKNSSSCANSYAQAVRALHLDVKVISRGDRVFMIKGATK